ncbi:hypothetical protein BaRGS_00022029 [Batillaria attramentaria]|uniref:Uncharacterized protein n=1 Tax=Batillaria attramentaria TaxID=370345 RepID=A0ABD0KIA1_9CAEN
MLFKVHLSSLSSQLTKFYADNQSTFIESFLSAHEVLRRQPKYIYRVFPLSSRSSTPTTKVHLSSLSPQLTKFYADNQSTFIESFPSAHEVLRRQPKYIYRVFPLRSRSSTPTTKVHLSSLSPQLTKFYADNQSTFIESFPSAHEVLRRQPKYIYRVFPLSSRSSTPTTKVHLSSLSSQLTKFYADNQSTFIESFPSAHEVLRRQPKYIYRVFPLSSRSSTPTTKVHLSSLSPQLTKFYADNQSTFIESFPSAHEVLRRQPKYIYRVFPLSSRSSTPTTKVHLSSLSSQLTKVYADNQSTFIESFPSAHEVLRRQPKYIYRVFPLSSRSSTPTTKVHLSSLSPQLTKFYADNQSLRDGLAKRLP